MIVRLADYPPPSRQSVAPDLAQAVALHRGDWFTVEGIATAAQVHLTTARRYVLAQWRSGVLERDGRRNARYREVRP